jgi:hypothetical protein
LWLLSGFLPQKWCPIEVSFDPKASHVFIASLKIKKISFFGLSTADFFKCHHCREEKPLLIDRDI